MKKSAVLSILAGMSLMTAGPAPAGTKPCRGKDGRVIECPKARKVSPRCKDAQGRFVACSTTAGGSQAGKQQSPR